MAELEINGRKFEVDEEGFLQDPSLWDDEVAALFASEEGIETMSDEHWAVVRYIRDYYEENDTAPLVRKIVQTTGLRLKEIYRLFPSGPAKGACKVAGLPKPDGCV